MAFPFAVDFLFFKTQIGFPFPGVYLLYGAPFTELRTVCAGAACGDNGSKEVLQVPKSRASIQSFHKVLFVLRLFSEPWCWRAVAYVNFPTRNNEFLLVSHCHLHS